MFSLKANAEKITDFASVINVIEHFNKILDFVLSENFREEIEQIQEEKKCDEITFSIESNGNTTVLIAYCWRLDDDGLINNYEAIPFEEFTSNKEG